MPPTITPADIKAARACANRLRKNLQQASRLPLSQSPIVVEIIAQTLAARAAAAVEGERAKIIHEIEMMRRDFESDDRTHAAEVLDEIVATLGITPAPPADEPLTEAKAMGIEVKHGT
jgi:hypothetical protein